MHPGEEFTATELAARFGVSLATASREADRLSAAGLLRERRRGNVRLLSAETDSALAGPLTDLLALTFGPSAVLGRLLAPITGIAEAYIYGSWAARYRGEAGAAPRDLDLLIIGDADEDELYDAARLAERRLGREVNVRRVSARRWRDHANDPFLATVRGGPLVPVKLEELS